MAGPAHRFWLTKVFVAGPAAGRAAIQRRIEQLCKLDGVVATHDWTRDPAPGEGDNSATLQAEARLHGVCDCNLLVVDLTGGAGGFHDALVEVGIALGRDIPVWVVAGAGRQIPGAFAHAPGVARKESWKEVLAELS